MAQNLSRPEPRHTWRFRPKRSRTIQFEFVSKTMGLALPPKTTREISVCVPGAAGSEIAVCDGAGGPEMDPQAARKGLASHRADGLRRGGGHCDCLQAGRQWVSDQAV